MIFVVLGSVCGGMLVGLIGGYYLPRRTNDLIDMDCLDLSISKYKINDEDFD